MALDPISSIIEVGGKLIDKFVPDPQAAAQAKLEFAKLEVDLAKQQNDVNAAEAANTNIFVSGWRPFVGWICGIAFGFKYLGGPLLFMVAQFFDKVVVLPNIDAADLIPILLGMLGLGAMRSFDKKIGQPSDK